MIAAAVLAACGAGGDGQTTVASGGTGGTGIAYGSVTGFGSVIVNGVKFHTANATVTVDGEPGPDETTDPRRGLSEGMVIRVEGTIDPTGTTGTAARVTYGDDVEGPISHLLDIDTHTRQATVLGQTVIVDTQTVFRGTSLAELAVGNVVEVSGLVDDQDRIHATYIEKKADAFAPGMELDVKGTIGSLDESTETFRIGSLTVSYASADTDDLPGGAPANALFVEVKGTSFGPGGELVATKVERDVEGIADYYAGEAEIEGFVTAVSGPNSFVIGNQPFMTTGATSYKGGVATDVVVGAKLEVEGRLVNGVLMAEEVEFRDSIKLESAVAAVDSEGSLTLKGLPGITVGRNDLTRVEGYASGAEIAADDLVKIRARIRGGDLVASKIEAVDPDPEKTKVELQGPVSAIDGSALVIVGVRVDTAGTRFSDADERPVTSEQFFAALSLNELVEVEGELAPDGVAVLWKEVELKE